VTRDNFSKRKIGFREAILSGAIVLLFGLVVRAGAIASSPPPPPVSGSDLTLPGVPDSELAHTQVSLHRPTSGSAGGQLGQLSQQSAESRALQHPEAVGSRIRASVLAQVVSGGDSRLNCLCWVVSLVATMPVHHSVPPGGVEPATGNIPSYEFEIIDARTAEILLFAAGS
jgi:hypothetical protein